jgi:uncharacterized protein
MGHDLWVALALVMVIEGILPFLNPSSWRDMMRTATELDDRTLRRVGLGSMLLGVALLYLVN